MISNSKGTRFFGLHFYPGVAEYRDDPKEKPYRVFLNEDTLRAMDKTFEGRPVFVMHVDGVEEDIDQLRGEADGWVLRSFYNAADGKHWVEFLVVSEKGLEAIQHGWQLSNSYFPQTFGSSGTWNGVSYDKEITGGEYEHLALVPNPRYEESIVLTPEEFKDYNERKKVEIERLSNQRESGKMKLSIFQKKKVEKVENGTDLESLVVILPKSKKERTITQLVEFADERLSNSPMAAHPEHLVDMGEGKKMTVNDMHMAYNAAVAELKDLKEKHDDATEEETEVDMDKEGVDVEGDDKSKDNDEDMGESDPVPMSANTNEDDDDMDDKKKEKKNKKKNDKDDQVAAARAKAEEKKRIAKEKAARLRNAPDRVQEQAPEIHLDKASRGKELFGS